LHKPIPDSAQFSHDWAVAVAISKTCSELTKSCYSLFYTKNWWYHNHGTTPNQRLAKHTDILLCRVPNVQLLKILAVSWGLCQFFHGHFGNLTMIKITEQKLNSIPKNEKLPNK
jgi:hypothetical protein